MRIYYIDIGFLDIRILEIAYTRLVDIARGGAAILQRNINLWIRQFEVKNKCSTTFGMIITTFFEYSPVPVSLVIWKKKVILFFTSCLLIWTQHIL